MPSPRSFLPSAGNPMLPVFISHAIFFPALIIGFPLYVHFTGGPVGQTIGIVFMLGILGLILGAILLWSVHSIEQERRQLWSDDVWAVWTIPEDEYRHFVSTERRRMVPFVLGLVALFSSLALFIYVGTRDPAAIAMMAVIFGATVLLVIVLEVGHLVTNDKTKEVRIGPRGIEAMGQYHQLRSRGHILEAVQLHTETPPHLLFQIWAKGERGSNRSQILRVPVPEDRIDEARAIVERFALTPPPNETYPELLRRKRAEREKLLRERAGHV